MRTYLHLSQNEVDQMVSDLVEQIKKRGKEFASVVGLANGGLHISRHVADALNLSHRVFAVSHYDGTEPRKEPIVPQGDIPEIKHCLIVDDLIDHGRTLRTCDEIFGLPDNAIAVLFWNRETTDIIPDFYVENKPNAWIVFPWEE